jgi:hypothetical protein
MSDLRLKDREGVHADLFRAHWDMSRGADKLHGVLLALMENERWRDQRAQVAPLIERLRAARDKIQDALLEAGDVRTEIIRLTGCDGTCHGKGPSKAPSDD